MKPIFIPITPPQWFTDNVDIIKFFICSQYSLLPNASAINNRNACDLEQNSSNLANIRNSRGPQQDKSITFPFQENRKLQQSGPTSASLFLKDLYGF